MYTSMGALAEKAGVHPNTISNFLKTDLLLKGTMEGSFRTWPTAEGDENVRRLVTLKQYIKRAVLRRENGRFVCPDCGAFSASAPGPVKSHMRMCKAVHAAVVACTPARLPDLRTDVTVPKLAKMTGLDEDTIRDYALHGFIPHGTKCVGGKYKVLRWTQAEANEAVRLIKARDKAVADLKPIYHPDAKRPQEKCECPKCHTRGTGGAVKGHVKRCLVVWGEVLGHPPVPVSQKAAERADKARVKKGKRHMRNRRAAAAQRLKLCGQCSGRMRRFTADPEYAEVLVDIKKVRKEQGPAAAIEVMDTLLKYERDCGAAARPKTKAERHAIAKKAAATLKARKAARKNAPPPPPIPATGTRPDAALMPDGSAPTAKYLHTLLDGVLVNMVTEQDFLRAIRLNVKETEACKAKLAALTTRV